MPESAGSRVERFLLEDLMKKLLQNCPIVLLMVAVIGIVFVLVFVTRSGSVDNAVVSNTRNQVVEPINSEPPVEPYTANLTDAEIEFMISIIGNDEDGGILNDPEYIREQKEQAAARK